MKKNNITSKVIAVMVLIISISFTLISAEVEATTKKVSYLMNTKKIYTYGFYDNEGNLVDKYTYKFSKKRYGYYNWRNGEYNLDYKETKKGFYDGSISCECNQPVLKFPVKKGEKWTEKAEGYTYQIIETKKTVKVKAGTFKNVVAVKTTTRGIKGFYIDYFAPNNGIILSQTNNKDTNYKTKKERELIKSKYK